MTRLIASITGECADEIRERIDAALARGADAIELRADSISGMSADDYREIRRELPDEVPVILTIRSAAEGGQWDGADDERISRLIELGPFADYLDVELELWRRSANIRQKIELALRRADPAYQEGGEDASTLVGRRKLILSRHDLSGRPPTLQKDLLDAAAESACNVVKFAWTARSVRDNFEAAELLCEAPKPSILICMGPDGEMSRILAKKFAAFGMFAGVDAGLNTAPGQLTIEELKRDYRWDAINSDTELYGVIGDPVAHSLSPAVHNAAFERFDMNRVYLKCPVRAGYESFKALAVEVQSRLWLGFRGFSVTIPHKENALRFIEECNGRISDAARRIGAVNTIVIDKVGSWIGHNTDFAAAVDCMETACGGADALRGRRALVLGAGGVARAVVAGLIDAGASVVIANRTASRAALLAKAFGVSHVAWDRRDRSAQQTDLIVNCTSVGMWPEVGESPISAEALSHAPAVVDTVYRPRRTRLLSDAAGRGCATVDGLALFVRQAAEQFALWTRQRVDPAGLARTAADRMERA